MNTYRWTIRIAIAGSVFFVLIVLSTVILRLLDVSIVGIQPEALVLTVMMTTPLTIGAVIISTGIIAVIETLLRRNCLGTG